MMQHPASASDLGGQMLFAAEERKQVKRILREEKIYMAAGTLLMTVLCIMPVWNSAELLQNANYVFWAGRWVPQMLIFLTFGCVVLFVVTVVIFFKASHNRSEQTIMMLSNIFITLLGIVLLLMSMVLTHQSLVTYGNLLHHCDYSEETHELFHHSQWLQDIRRQPGCLDKESVEECVGFEAKWPYTGFLKNLESDFRCRGFCFKPLPPMPVSLLSTSSSLANSSMPPQRMPRQKSVLGTALLSEINDASTRTTLFHGSTLRQALVEASEESAIAAATSVGRDPLTLFSKAKYKNSCEGVAARGMRYFAGDIGNMTFYQGIYLIVIAILTGFLKICGFCVRSDNNDVEQRWKV